MMNAGQVLTDGAHAAASEVIGRRGPGEPQPTLGELRLRSVIECAPVSLVVASPDGNVLAANGATLALFGVERLDELVGHALDRLVATEHRTAVTEFVTRVCHGEPAVLEYEVVGPGETRRTVETHAVPLRRNGFTPAAFLGATWDVSERRRLVAAEEASRTTNEGVRAQRGAVDEALREAQRAHEELSQRHREVQESLRDAQFQLHTTEVEAAERQEELANRWACERERLEARLRELHDQEREVSAVLLAERESRQAEIAQLTKGHEAALTAHTSEARQLRDALSTVQSDLDTLRLTTSAERANVAAMIQDVESRCANLLGKRDAEHERLTQMLHAERTRYSHLVEEHARWKADVVNVLTAIQHMGRDAERLLDGDRRTSRVSEDRLEDAAPVERPVGRPTPDADYAKDVQWGF